MKKEIQKRGKGMSATIRGTAEHVDAFQYICDQLGGELKTNPDGSITVTFVLSTTNNNSPNSFNIKSGDSAIGRSVCSQLGGKYIKTKSGAKCEFFLPQDPRWSINPISNDAALVRFDSDTFYIATSRDNGIACQVYLGGRLIENISLVESYKCKRIDVVVTGVDGTTSKMKIVNSEGLVTLSYLFDDETIFCLEETISSIQTSFMLNYSKNPQFHVDVPYLNLLFEKIQKDSLFRRQIEPFFKPNNDGATEDIVYFCAGACGICAATLEPHACYVCTRCLSAFTSTPSNNGLD